MAQLKSRPWPVLLAAVRALSVNLLAAANDSEWSARVWRLDDGLPDDNVTGVVQTSDGYLWVATDSGLARFDGVRFQNIALPIPSGRSRPLIRAMLLERENQIWLALEGGLVVSLSRQETNLFTTTNGLSTFIPPTVGVMRALAEDTAGTLWCGTEDGQLLRVEGDKLKNETPPIFSRPRPIRCMNAMPDGSMWIGYAVAGLGIWHNGKFAEITEAQGLHDPYICSMAADDGGGFWFASDHGIFQVRVSEIEAVAEGRAERVHSTVFGRDEGLSGLQAFYGYAPGAAKSRDGRLWFPMRTGLAVVNPRHVPANRVPPRLLIERGAVDGPVTQPNAAGRFVLAPGHHRLDVDFTAPTFVAPESIRFRYRVEEWDDDWIDGGTKRRASYSRLPAGDYVFRVTACNNAGIWNENGATCALTVLPFVWQRWPVRAAMLCVFTLGVIAAVRYVSYRRLRLKLSRLERETALQRERTRIAQDLHDDIGASLTHIALLSELAQKDFDKPLQAKGHMDQIFRSAQTVVRSLDEIVWTVNPKNNTLDLFIAYLCTYAPDYLRSAGIRCRLDVPVDVPTMPLPSEVGHHLYLVVKETLHNVVKHAAATQVWLRLRLAEETITLTIEDNGRGFQTHGKVPTDADGLGNLNRRLGEIGGQCEQRSEQRSEHGKGTTTTFILPLKNQPV